MALLIMLPLVAYGTPFLRTAGSTDLTSIVATSSLPFENLLQEDIHDMIRRYSKEYNVPYEQVDKIIYCETNGTYDPKIQSSAKYKFSDPRRSIVYGQRERSYGLVQIHQPDWPDVTMEQMTDPEFAVEFLLEHWSERYTMWYWCSRK